MSALGQKRTCAVQQPSDREGGHAANDHVCFRPESGRVQCTGSRLLWAISGHHQYSVKMQGGVISVRNVLRVAR
jgi:hypothetical protein